MAFSLAKSFIVAKPALLFLSRALRSSYFFISSTLSFSTSPASSFSEALPKANTHRKSKPVAASFVERGGVAISREEIVKNDPKNNIPDTIFSKLGMQLHRRDQHPIGILKNAIYDYFDSNYPGKFNKFDNLSPIVSVKANFDDPMVYYGDRKRNRIQSYYVDNQTVLRRHPSAHRSELLREGQTHYLVTGDVYRSCTIDCIQYPVFHLMEGVSVITPVECGSRSYANAAEDMKKCLEGLVRHLFGNVDIDWIGYWYLEPTFDLKIYFQENWLEVVRDCGVMSQRILETNGRTDSVAWHFVLPLDRIAMVLFDIPHIRLFWSVDKRFTSQFSKGQLGVKFKPFSKVGSQKNSSILRMPLIALQHWRY